MFRKFITLCLFSITVPFAVFGQDVFGHDDVKNLGSTAGHYLREQWPQAQDNLKENLPKAARHLSGALNDLSPSAGQHTGHNVNFTDLDSHDQQQNPWMI
jgi:hypothetical protein